MTEESWIKFVKNVMKTFSRLEIVGAENVPTEGGAIVAINHIGRMDMLLGVAATPRYDLSGWAAEKYQKWPVVNKMIEAIDGIWIDRFNTDMGAMRAAIERLKGGRLMGIAPEGTRSPNRSLIEGKQGVAYLAAMTGVPIIPAGLVIPKNSGWKMLFLMRPKLSFRFGEPFYLPKLERGRREEQLQTGTDEIMCQIAALIPPEYRGVYADHPRLVEILGNDK